MIQEYVSVHAVYVINITLTKFNFVVTRKEKVFYSFSKPIFEQFLPLVNKI